ncbi:protein DETOXIFICATION 16-like [Lolium rigidum]|uniref:protein DETOXIFICATION 16-like n=1 Tax=Lolium rigidum TaxID=89674 RepID=UPI001F5E2140|nr:protein DETOXIFICATION 16-like [Lolium rigidum]
MATALDTLCGQAFGAGQHGLLCIYTQRTMVVLALACVPIVAVWANATRILVFLGQDRAIAAVAGEFTRWLIPSLGAYVPLLCHVRFLQAQSVVLPVTASSVVAVLCHVPVCWAMVYKTGMGSNGAAVSYTISCGVSVAILALYVRLFSRCENTWTGFSVQAFKGLDQIAKLALPSAMMICLEWWSFEILIFLSGLLPNPELETSVLSICVNTGSLLYMIPLGLAYSISTVVANELGSGKPQPAKLAARVVMCMAFTEGLVIALAMVFLRHVWGYMYSDKQQVVSYIARMLPILSISFFMDGLHGSLSGVLTGCGKQKIGAGVNLGAFYLLGIPTAALLAFVFHFNGTGLWLGVVCGSFMKLVLLLRIAWCIDWEKEALKAKDLVCSSSVAGA